MQVTINIDDPSVRCVPFEPGLKRLEVENLRLIMTNDQFADFCKGIARAWKEWTGMEIMK